MKPLTEKEMIAFIEKNALCVEFCYGLLRPWWLYKRRSDMYAVCTGRTLREAVRRAKKILEGEKK